EGAGVNGRSVHRLIEGGGDAGPRRDNGGAVGWGHRGNRGSNCSNEDHIHPVIGRVEAGRGEGARRAVNINTVGAHTVGKGMEGWVIDTCCAKESGVDGIVTRRSIVGSYISRAGGNCNRTAEVHLLPPGGALAGKDGARQQGAPGGPQIADVRSSVCRALVKAYARDRASLVRGELHAQFDCRPVAAIRSSGRRDRAPDAAGTRSRRRRSGERPDVIRRQQLPIRILYSITTAENCGGVGGGVSQWCCGDERRCPRRTVVAHRGGHRTAGATQLEGAGVNGRSVHRLIEGGGDAGHYRDAGSDVGWGHSGNRGSNCSNEDHIHPVIGRVEAGCGEGARRAVNINTVGAHTVGKGMEGGVIDTCCAKESGVDGIVTRRSIVGSYISRAGGNCNRTAEVHLLPPGGALTGKDGARQQGAPGGPQIADVRSS